MTMPFKKLHSQSIVWQYFAQQLKTRNNQLSKIQTTVGLNSKYTDGE